MKFGISLFRNLSPLVELPIYSDDRGNLSVLEHDFSGMEWKRSFWIKGVPPGAVRGCHAHRSCVELLFPVSGSFDLELCNGVETLQLHLHEPNKGVIIPPMVWCKLFNFSEDAVALCFASQKYDAEGYIHHYEEFLKEVGASAPPFELDT